MFVVPPTANRDRKPEAATADLELESVAVDREPEAASVDREPEAATIDCELEAISEFDDRSFRVLFRLFVAQIRALENVLLYLEIELIKTRILEVLTEARLLLIKPLAAELRWVGVGR
nr:hypothetical protein Iba_chr14bCG9760 [Ipomoea batatas]